MTMLETKPEGAAVTRTERTDGVGRAAARDEASGPRLMRNAGSVGKEVMPARVALVDGLAFVYSQRRLDTLLLFMTIGEI